LTVESVAGPVSVDDVGLMSMHEHVTLFVNTALRENYLWCPWEEGRRAAMETAVRKMSAGREAGLDAFLDCSTVDMTRDAHFIAEASRRSGLNVMLSTGLAALSPPLAWSYFETIGVERSADLMTRDVEVSIAGTDIKACAVKCLLDQRIKNLDLWPAPEAYYDDTNGQSGTFGLRVAAETHRRTGVLIHVHTNSRTRNGVAACDILEECSVDLSRVLLHHVGDTDDMEYLHTLLARGVSLGMDPHRKPWHIETIAALVGEGYASRLTLGVDSTQVFDFDPIEGVPEGERAAKEFEFAMTYMPLAVLPALRKHGVSDGDIDLMVRQNPFRLLERP
jgi:phosphotriesterase-related protein